MIVKNIPIRGKLNRAAFSRWLENPISPIILSDAMEGWPALERWSFEYFAEHFGDYPIVANAPQFAYVAKWTVKTTLGSYIEYLKNPAHIQGDWIKGDLETLTKSGLTLYAGNFNPAHPSRGRPDLIFEDVPKEPSFIESWFDLLDADFVDRCFRLQSHQFVYLSIAGGVTPLHHDFWQTHAFLAQICGVKRAFLFAPEFMDELYSENTGDVPKMMLDKRFAHVTCWGAELRRGQMLIIPSNWLHWVETLSPSITYSIDWIDGVNWQAYVEEGKKVLVSRGGGHETG